MKKTTSLKLSKQLAKYGALTAAIIGVADANGQSIIHNDISDFIGGTGDTFLLDINNDGVNDFQITHNFYSSSYYSSSYRNLRMKPLTASNSILGSGANGDNYVYPFALAHGDDISSAADRKSTRLNSSHVRISYAVFCLKKKTKMTAIHIF